MLKIRFGQKENPLQLGSVVLNCYILENKLRVLTLNSIQKALGYEGKSENWVIEFIDKLNTFFPIDSDLVAAFRNAVLIEINDIKGKRIFVESIIESQHFIRLCQVIIKAKEEGFLNIGQLKHAKAALLIVKTVEKTSIEDLIDQVTGFTRYKIITLERFVTLLKKQQNDTAVDWIKTIPIDFIEVLLEANHLSWEDVQEKPSTIVDLFHEIIFSRIENDALDAIRKSKPKRAYTRKNNKKQEIGHPRLQEYILILNSLLKASGKNWNIFIQLLNKTYPKQNNSKIIFIENKEEIVPYADFNSKLKTVIFK
jgi:hypothetical protein